MSLRGLLLLLAARPEFGRLRERIAPGARSPLLTGVGEAARPYLVATLAAELARPVLYVVRESEAVAPTADALSVLLGRETPVLPYLDRDALPYERLMSDADTVRTRMRALMALAHRPSTHGGGTGNGRQRQAGEPLESSLPSTRGGGAGGQVCVVVCSARALTQPVLPPRELQGVLLELRAGLELDPRALLEHLLSLGYEPVAEVEESGQVSHRGGIVDLFAPALERPLRVEFLGDEIDSIRTFDPTTQRSLNPQEIVARWSRPRGARLARTRGRRAAIRSSTRSV